MEFKFPLPKLSKKPPQQNSISLPLFNWDELSEKDLIGQGGYGSVLSAKFKGETVVAKKLISETESCKKIFIKEAKFLNDSASDYVVKFLGFCWNPMAIMMEYMFFDFSIFGLDRKVSSLKDLLAVLHSECMFNSFESFPVFISKEVISAISYLHSRGIAHRDLKTFNCF